MAQSVHATEPRMLAMDIKLHDYWVKRSNALGRKAGLSDQAIGIRQLIIPLKAERFKDVMIACLDMTPGKALR